MTRANQQLDKSPAPKTLEPRVITLSSTGHDWYEIELYLDRLVRTAGLAS